MPKKLSETWRSWWVDSFGGWIAIGILGFDGK